MYIINILIARYINMKIDKLTETHYAMWGFWLLFPYIVIIALICEYYEIYYIYNNTDNRFKLTKFWGWFTYKNK